MKKHTRPGVARKNLGNASGQADSSHGPSSMQSLTTAGAGPLAVVKSSARRKPRGKSPGKPDAEIVKLKELWLNPRAKIDRVYWRKLFMSSLTQAQIRQKISDRLGIHLNHDARLTDFRHWLESLDAVPK